MIYFEDNFTGWLSGVNFKKLVTFTGGTATTGTQIITSASATALAVGPSGATNPTLSVDSSETTAVTGVLIEGFAAGSGVNIETTSSGTNEAITLNAKGSGAIVIGGVSTGMVSIGRGSLSTLLGSSTITALGTTQNSTPTAAQLLGGVITQTGATGAGTVTLPTGTQLSTAVPGVTVGDTFTCMYANLGGGFNEVITGATGSTVVGNATVPSGKNATMLFVNTGANTWNVYCMISA